MKPCYWDNYDPAISSWYGMVYIGVDIIVIVDYIRCTIKMSCNNSYVSNLQAPQRRLHIPVAVS